MSQTSSDVSLIHPLIADLVAWIDRAERPANEWHGVDIKAGFGEGIVRLASESENPAESVTVYRLSGNGILHWQARFDASTPRNIIAAMLAEALATPLRSAR